jgi:signal transduction histidine kinase
MARRIVVTVLALIIVLLASVAVPLGLLTSAQDRQSFRDETTAAAVTLANVAEERIDDRTAAPALNRSARGLTGQGYQVTVYDTAGRAIASYGGQGLGASHLRRGAPATRSRSYWPGDRFLVLVPVVPDSGVGAIGTVAVARSTEPVDHRIAMLWTLIGSVSAVGLLVAAGIGAALARWASRPITVLAEAARQLGGGALDTRARVATGPPEVRRLSATFNVMAERLQSLVRSQQSLMADVSHQVRTPLAALRLRLDLLAQDTDEATAAELASAQGEIIRMSRLVSGLLAVARAEQAAPARALVDVSAVLRDRASAWRPAAAERGVALTVLAPVPLWVWLGDGHLEQILDNLIDNGLEALPARGAIRLAASATAEVVRISVADDGRGMTDQQKRAAFRRFGSGAPGGTGLGLAIVDRLVAAGGGSVTLDDTAGGGVTVSIELPRADPRHHHHRSEPTSSETSGELNQFRTISEPDPRKPPGRLGT